MTCYKIRCVVKYELNMIFTQVIGGEYLCTSECALICTPTKASRSPVHSLQLVRRSKDVLLTSKKPFIYTSTYIPVIYT